MIKVINGQITLYGLSIILIVSLSGCANRQAPEPDIEKIKKEAANAAMQWNHNWAGRIDAQAMMSQYHKDMTYVWHGNVDTYESFRQVVEKYIAPASNDTIPPNKVFDMQVTVLSQSSAIVFFHMGEEGNPESEIGAFSLVLIKEDETWKVIHVHESAVTGI